MAETDKNIYQTIQTMSRVIFALILRETKTRYGRTKIGYIWALLEPLLFITILSLIFGYAKAMTTGNMPQILFFITGLLPFFLFRDIAMMTMLAVNQNLQLLYYPQVQILDLGLARMLLELSKFIIVMTLLTSMIALFGIEPVHIENFILLSATSLAIALFGLGTGLIAGAIIPLFPSMEFLTRFLFIQPLFWVSGIFFTADILPSQFASLVLLNPMLHMIELFRSAFFYQFESHYVSIPYIFAAVLSTLFIGLLMQRALRKYAFQV